MPGYGCEEPQLYGDTWDDAGAYILALKRELRICAGRLDAVIKWRRVVERKQ
ncbi:Rz1-like lysis system protein LysC [Budvicia aquatica]|uniref:Rz1-like lysis system protein LysC n=1 Tax=Budvicia aquatica TaxID=82979 RepID=UPI0040394C1D